jgi:hypothetical protein
MVRSWAYVRFNAASPVLWILWRSILYPTIYHGSFEVSSELSFFPSSTNGPSEASACLLDIFEDVPPSNESVCIRILSVLISGILLHGCTASSSFKFWTGLRHSLVVEQLHAYRKQRRFNRATPQVSRSYWYLISLSVIAWWDVHCSFWSTRRCWYDIRNHPES